MLLTKSELQTLKKAPMVEDPHSIKLKILRAGKGDKTVEELQQDLKDNGFSHAVSTVRAMCQKNKIEYFKRSSHPNKKKKGKPIIIGKK